MRRFFLRNRSASSRLTRMLRIPSLTAGSAPDWIKEYMLPFGTEKYSAASGTFIQMPVSWPNFTSFQEDVDASAYISIGPEMGAARFP